MSRVDLHMHTTASDGTLSPEELLVYAKEKGIEYCAISDHDTMDGYLQGKEKAKELGLTLIPAIEISTGYRGIGVHVLGYCLDPLNPSLEPVLNFVQKDRVRRNHQMIQLMQEDGIDISYEKLEEEYGDIIGRPHMAKALMKLGLVSSISDAFDRYLKRGEKYYVKREYISFVDAIEKIHACGGIAILAHPYQYKYEGKDWEQFMLDAKNADIDGIEVYYSGYDLEQIDTLLEIAKENNWIVTGGSDYHGTNKPHIDLGVVNVPDSCICKLLI
ncbi:MAG: PHP domain-containing protein [Firmicutes bacterium]|nr:PHP domain-containing protein [Bacillota bacterium]